MKPKELMLSAAVILGSAAIAFAQTYTQPPQTPAGPTSPQPGTTEQQQQMNNGTSSGSNAMASGTGSSATQSNNAQPGSTTMNQAQNQPRTSKHRAMASRYTHSRMGEHDRATTALNLLEEKGYRDFTSLHPMGRDFEVTANQNGRNVNVVVESR